MAEEEQGAGKLYEICGIFRGAVNPISKCQNRDMCSSFCSVRAASHYRLRPDWLQEGSSYRALPNELPNIANGSLGRVVFFVLVPKESSAKL